MKQQSVFTVFHCFDNFDIIQKIVSRIWENFTYPQLLLLPQNLL